MTAGAFPSDAQWLEIVGDRLRRVVPELVPGADPVQRLSPIADDVWLVELAGGGCVVAKHQFYGLLSHGQPHDLLQVELEALRFLRRRGCAVPVAFGTDPESQTILLEFVGHRTLGEAMVSRSAPRRWLTALWHQIERIESCLTQDPRWEGRIAPGASRADLLRAWDELQDQVVAGARALPGVGDGRDVPETQIRNLHRRLSRWPPRLGPTDYQPGNVVIDSAGQRLTFLELSKLGWDWTPRRAVQYTSLPDVDAVSLLDASSVDSVGLDEVSRSVLDGHHLVYHLLLVRRLHEVRAPGTRLSPSLKRALVEPLSDNPLIGELRRRLRDLTTRQDDP